MRHNAPDTMIIIPARLESARLPGKVLADICGKPMIIYVWEKAMEAALGEVLVACDSAAVAETVERYGGKAVLTEKNLPSGSDRIAAALDAYDVAGKITAVINLQGDLPEVSPDLLRRLAKVLAESNADIVTPVAPLKSDEAHTPSIVKAVVSWHQDEMHGRVGQALYFSRADIPYGENTERWHHIGIYGWRREALKRFIALPASPLERAEALEQLRALENGMSIAAIAVDTAPRGVDTEDDLTAVRHRFIRKKQQHA